MAISIIKTTATGFIVNGTYSRVENIQLTKERMSFNLKHYKEKGRPFFSDEILCCEYDIEGDNPIAQAYEYLKTLDEFKDAEDV